MRRSGKNGLAFVLIHLMALTLACTAWARVAGEAQQMPAGMSSDWWTQAQAHIRQGEYHPRLARVAGTDQAQTLQAPNRAHNIRTTFSPEGVRVAPRTANGPEWSWGLTLTSLGAPGELRPVEPAQLRHEGNRVELVRGPVIEWYRNDERGLEQGFTLPEPPQGSAGVAELVLRLAVQGTLSGSLDPGGSALTFAAPDGRPRLRFDHLLAVDDTGRNLPARFGLDDGHLEIIVATAGAQYPLLIDPLATSANWTAESNQGLAGFGYSVASAGDVNHDGYDDVIVGAPDYDNGSTDEGRAFVFHGSATGLSPTPNWTAESDQAGAVFGWSVASAGDVNGDGFDDVIVGAPYADYGQAEEGAVAVYHGSATGLQVLPAWTAQSDQAGAGFGLSVAAAGDVNGDGYDDVIVGAPSADFGQINEGWAALFLGSAIGLQALPDWTAQSDQVEATFGTSVAAAGDVNGDGYDDVIIGAPNAAYGQTGEGAVAVYHGSATGLQPLPAWAAQSDQAEAHFGVSVATAGDVNGDGFADILVGAPYADFGQTNEGAVAVYHGSASGLSLVPNWTAQSDQADAQFGRSVSMAGDVNHDGYDDVIIGAPQYNNGATTGRASIFYGSSGGLRPTPGWTVESDQAFNLFGCSVSTAGDVNGDGFADIIIGASMHDRGQTDEGAAFVFHGSSSGSFFVIPTPANKPVIIYLE